MFPGAKATRLLRLSSTDLGDLTARTRHILVKTWLSIDGHANARAQSAVFPLIEFPDSPNVFSSGVREHTKTRIHSFVDVSRVVVSILRRPAGCYYSCHAVQWQGRNLPGSEL